MVGFGIKKAAGSQSLIKEHIGLGLLFQSALYDNLMAQGILTRIPSSLQVSQNIKISNECPGTKI